MNAFRCLHRQIIVSFELLLVPCWCLGSSKDYVYPVQQSDNGCSTGDSPLQITALQVAKKNHTIMMHSSMVPYLFAVCFAAHFVISESVPQIFRSACRRDVLMNATDHGKQLVGIAQNVIAEIHASKLASCVKNCMVSEKCLTINYKKLPAYMDENNCQLLNVSKSNESVSLSNAEGWIHYEPANQERERNFLDTLDPSGSRVNAMKLFPYCTRKVGPRCRFVSCSAGLTCSETCALVSGYECVDIDECLSFPCQNGGTCSNGMNQYSCTCLTGYSGNNCQIVAPSVHCSSSVCLNGGTCVAESDPMKVFKCNCPDAYLGTHCELTNIARGKATWQSSQHEIYDSGRAVDGLAYTTLGQGSCSHTAEDSNAWWRVDLGAVFTLGTVRITNRDICSERLSNFYVRVGQYQNSPSSNQLCYHYPGQVGKAATVTLTCASNVHGQFLFVILGQRDNLQLCEVQVYSVVKKSKSCREMRLNGGTADGVYNLWDLTETFQYSAYCHMSADGWTLIARFSNADALNWGKSSGSYWYSQTAVGATYSPAVNSDMINMAFYNAKGTDIKLTRSDSASHKALLIADDCIGTTTFRAKITSYGDFRNNALWSANKCEGSCTVHNYGPVSGVSGFSQYACSGTVQASNKIGFWCHYGSGDAAVIMIGGGGADCGRADHGIVVTEADNPQFGSASKDFGDDTTGTQSYALNLWIR